MGKDIKKQAVEARRSYSLHRDGASWRHRWLFEWRPAMEQGIPMRNRGWEEPRCPSWKREALAMRDREGRGATCQGQGSSQEWRQPPQANTTPPVHITAKFLQGMALLERVG